MIKFNKIVRDNIPRIIKSTGRNCLYRICTDEEAITKLMDKIEEEYIELKQSNNPEEIADLLEVIECLISKMGYSVDEINRIKESKKQRNGSFNNNIVLIEAEKI